MSTTPAATGRDQGVAGDPAQAGASGREIELKLLLDEAGFDAAQRIGLLGGPGRGSRARLRATYYDTEEHALFRARMVLRVRSRGRSHVMTLKRAAPAGEPMARPETEAPVPTAEPDLARLGAGVAAELAEVTGGAALLPAFGTDIRRVARILPYRASRIEAAFDSGAVLAGERSLPVRELELELKQGEPADLFAFALDVLEQVPARLGVMSKAERGALLARGEAPQAVRAAPALEPGQSVDDAIGAVLGSCVHQFIANWPAFEAGGAPEPVHQMRVAMRRLRAALALFQRSFPGAELGAFRAEARRIAAAMGEARNWDVFTGMLREGPQAVLGDGAGFQALLDASQGHRAAGYRQVAALIEAPDTTRFVLELLEFLARRGWRNAVDAAHLPRLTAPADAFAAQHLERLRRKVRKRGKHMLRLPDEERHEVRIALKALRYATDFFGALYGDAQAVRAYARAAARLQDVLGSFNDMAMAGDLVRRLDLGGDMDAVRAGGVLIGWYGRGAQADLGRLRDTWQAFRKARPFWRDALPGTDAD